MSPGNQNSSIPIFPLSNAVLFPKIKVPLHIFEERYRQMTADAIQGGMEIGMVVVDPQQVQAMAGNPGVFPVGCAGTISEFDQMPDGRYNIVLHGTRRFRILQESPPEGDRLYRLADVENLEDLEDPRDHQEIVALRPVILDQVRNVVLRKDPAGNFGILEQWLNQIDDEVFTNTICQVIDIPAIEKCGLLEASTILSRAQRLEELLRFHLSQHPSPGTEGSGSVH